MAINFKNRGVSADVARDRRAKFRFFRKKTSASPSSSDSIRSSSPAPNKTLNKNSHALDRYDLSLKAFDVYCASSDFGLSSSQAENSRLVYGSNSLTQKKRKTFFRHLLENFGDPMIKVLLIALSINIVFLFGQSNWFESLGIAAAVFIAIVVSAVSEYGSESAFKKLQQSTLNVTVRVKRDGKTILLPTSQLVNGDIVLLGAGDKIPADGEIISGKVEVDQSALNGESKEALKQSGGKNPNGRTENASSNGKAGSDFLNPLLLFGGTVVVGGSGVMRITAVGDNTFYGRLAAEIQEETPPSPLKVKLATLAKKISRYGYFGAGLVAVAYLFNALVIKNSFMGAEILADLTNTKVILSHILSAATLAVTVMVMAVPEGLPMMITVVLSSNMRRMLKDNVLVRKLNGIETAGSLNILFTDKTGTLTKGRLEAVSFVSGEGKVYGVKEMQQIPASKPFRQGGNPSGDLYSSGDFGGKGGLNVCFGDSPLKSILACSLLYNTDAEMVGGKAAGGNATDRALLELAHKFPNNNLSGRKLSSVPFSGDRKFMSTVLSLGGSLSGNLGGSLSGKKITLLKGAPERIIEGCTRRYTLDGSIASFTAGYKKTVEEMSSKAIRVVAIAVSENEITEGQPLENLILVGFVGIRDQIRPEATRGVKQIHSAGIQTVMITGDSKATATAVARETGILEDDGLVITSDELSKMSDAELRQKLLKLRVVARALPTDKSRLVKIAQSLNLVAGMTGDGVNDAPALKKADIGFAMGSGTEVAKEAGDVVILDDNILSIARAVSYGRTIFKSIRKFIIFQLTVNFCAMAISIIAPLINVEMPITVIQMLWINLVIDTLAGLAFGGERPRAKYMTEPPKRRDEPIINRYMWQQIILSATYIAIISLWFLKSRLVSNAFAGREKAYAMTAFFTLFMFTALFNSLNARTHKLNLLDYLALNKQFISIMLSIAVIQTLLIYFGGSVFRTVPLEVKHLLLIILFAFSIVPFDLIRKFVAFKRGKPGGT